MADLEIVALFLFASLSILGWIPHKDLIHTKTQP